LAATRRRRDAALRAAEGQYQQAVGEIEARYSTGMEHADTLFARQTADHRGTRERRWNEMADTWRRGVQGVLSAVAHGVRQSATLFPDWHGPAWENWRPATTVPPGLRFGELLVRLAEVPHAVPEDERLRQGLPESLTLPALLPFPNRSSVLLKAGDSGRA